MKNFSRQSTSQRMAHNALKARARLKLDKLRRLAEGGATFDEAVVAINSSPTALRSFLFKRTGSKCWPPGR